jgi:hypothetical protein
MLGRKDRVVEILDLVVDQHTHGIALEAKASLNGVIQVDERFASIDTDILVSVLAEHLELIIFLHDFKYNVSLWGAKLRKKS